MESNGYEYFNIDRYFSDRQPSCDRFFSKAVYHGKKAVSRKYGTVQAQSILSEVKNEFDTLLPLAPYVGTMDILSRQMLLTLVFAAFYRTLQKNEDLGDIWALCYEFNRETLMGMPRFMRWLLKQATFSGRMRRQLRNLAEVHKEKNLADQWEYIEGDGRTFDYGMNVTRCAKLIFLHQIGAKEFAPYICLIDKNFAQCCGYGLKRTQVLAEGARHCDFRLSKNGPVDVLSSVG